MKKFHCLLAAFGLVWASNHARAAGFVPVRAEATGASRYVSSLRELKVTGLGQLMDLYGGRINILQRVIPSVIDWRDSTFRYRFVYSPKWGWIDMLHFTAGAWTNSLWLVHGYRVLKKGEQNERDQAAENQWSRWDYEDLISNLLGVYFQEYLSKQPMTDRRDFPGKLGDYLAAIGVVENPAGAPNWDRMLETEDQDDPLENHRYVPFNVADDYERLLNDFDRAVLAYLQGFLKWMGRTREDEVH